MKQKVQDKYRYCSTRRKVLLDHVTEGYECDYWLVKNINFIRNSKNYFILLGNIMKMVEKNMIIYHTKCL